MTVAAGDAHYQPVYAGRFRVVFPLLDADGDLVTGATTPDSEVSIDQGTFVDCTNEMTEIATASGMYYLDLTGAEMTGSCIAVIAKSATAGMKTTALTIYPRRYPVLRSGTAQAGAAGTITLDSGASAKDGAYNGCMIQCTNNSPANVQGMTRRIISYVGSTRVATVNANWGTNPSSATTFAVLIPETTTVASWMGVEPVDWNTLGVPVVDTVRVGGTLQTAGDIPARLPAALVSGRMDSSTGAMAAGVQTSASFSAGAIDANAIATDAIGSAELAAGAVTKIQAGLATAAAQAILQADTDDIQTRLPAALVSGRMDASVGAMAAAVQTSASFAAGAIDANAIATDAIGSAELATTAVSEIVTAMLTTQMTEAYAANGVAPTMAQALLAVHQMLMDFAISGTSLTVKKLDNTATAFVVTLNDASNPSSAVRT